VNTPKKAKMAKRRLLQTKFRIPEDVFVYFMKAVMRKKRNKLAKKEGQKLYK
jgi:hypothetical protein